MFSDRFDCAPRHFVKQQDHKHDADHEEDQRPPAQFGLAMQQKSVRRELKDPHHRRVRSLCAAALESPVTGCVQASISTVTDSTRAVTAKQIRHPPQVNNRKVRSFSAPLRSDALKTGHNSLSRTA